MPQQRRSSDRRPSTTRHERQQDDPPSGLRTAVTRTSLAITSGAVLLVLSGGLVLWYRSAQEVVIVPAPAAAPVAHPQPESVPAPAAPAPGATLMRTFARGIAFGCEALTIDGHRWLGQAQALVNGLELGPGTRIAPPASLAASHLDFDTKSMLDNGLTATGPVTFRQALPDGTYEVTLWVAGTRDLDASLLVLRLGGDDVPIGKAAGAANWSRIGPYTTRVHQRHLDVAVTGLGAAHLAGLAITALGSGDGTVPPVIALISPGADAQVYSSDLALVADIIPGSGRLVRIEFLDGETKLGEALGPPWSMSWSHPAIGRHELTAVAIDSAAERARSAPVAVTVKADDGSPDLLIERARDALRKLGLEPSLLSPNAGGLTLNLSGSTVTDLSWLKGLPLTDLDIHGTALTDLSPLAGMPLRRLYMHYVKPRDFAFLKGLPLTELYMFESGITDFAPLVGMKLEHLEAGNGHMTDLRPLAGMPLHTLLLQNCPITDATPLIGMPLEGLDVGGSKLRDLAPLAHLPLTVLSIWGCPLTSLAPLTGLRLKQLNMSSMDLDIGPLAGMPLEGLTISLDNGIHDLAPLAGMPLTRLDMWGVPATSLAPLAGMKLVSLRMGQTLVSDLTPLTGMPLVDLDLHDCEQVRSLAPVATLACLRKLTLPTHRPDLDSLRKLAGVQISGAEHVEPRDVSDFFKAQDAAKASK